MGHSGNNKTGGGDDERICIKFAKIPEEVDQMFVIVNCKAFGVTFRSVLTASCRIVGGKAATGPELARYDFIYGHPRPGLVMGRFLRQSAGRWGFQLLNVYCRGHTWMESMKKMKRLQALPP